MRAVERDLPIALVKVVSWVLLMGHSAGLYSCFSARLEFH